jgi:hypothetical protein
LQETIHYEYTQHHFFFIPCADHACRILRCFLFIFVPIETRRVLLVLLIPLKGVSEQKCRSISGVSIRKTKCAQVGRQSDHGFNSKSKQHMGTYPSCRLFVPFDPGCIANSLNTLQVHGRVHVSLSH